MEDGYKILIIGGSIAHRVILARLANLHVVMTGSTCTGLDPFPQDTTSLVNLSHELQSLLPEKVVVKKQKSFIHFQQKSFKRRGK